MHSTRTTRHGALGPLAILLLAGWFVVAAGEANGQEHRAAGSPSTPSTDLEVLALNPYAFEGLEAIDLDALRALGVQRYFEGDNFWGLEAPVVLRTGATVHRLELDAVAEGAGTAKVNFNRCAVGAAACEQRATISLVGPAGSDQVGVDLSAPETIDNSAYTYLAEVALGTDASTRVAGVRLLYSLPPSSASPEDLALQAYGFEGRDSATRNALASLNVQRHCSGTDCELLAPVLLPSGTVVSRIDVDVVDDSTDDDVAASLERCDRATGLCVELASVATSGTPGNIEIGADLAVAEVVDTSAGSYLARVALGDTADTRFVGYRVRFTPPDPIPDLDRLAVNAFAFEGRAAADIDAAEAVGVERYCSGSGCVLRAPVELATGTRVRRLELAAYDAGTGAVRASLQRCAVGAGSCEELAAMATTGSPGDLLQGVDLAPPVAVDNAGFTTMVEVALDGGSDHRLRAVHLVVDRSLFRDGFESGDTGAWSSVAP